MKKERDTEHVLSCKEETVKRLLMPILMIPLLALVLIGCDQDMRSNVVGFLKPMGNNVYLDSGMAPINTANVAAASDQIAGLGNSEESQGKVNKEDGKIKISETVFGVAVDLSAIAEVDEDTTFLAPQPKAAQEELKNQLGKALDAPKQKEQLKEDMKKPASAEQKKTAQGTAKIFNEIIKEIQGEDNDFLDKLKLPEIEEDDELTQGDMLMLQLMTDMVANTVETLKEIGGEQGLDGLGDIDPEDHIDDLLGIVDEALFAAQVAEELSGASSIDFTGGLDLTELLENIGGKGRSRIQARDDGDDDFLEDIIPTLFGLSKEVTKMMGAYIDGGEVKIGNQKYRTFLAMMKSYRSSLEHAFSLPVAKRHLKTARVANAMSLDLSSIIKYLLAVAVTEHDAYIRYYNGKNDKNESSRELVRKALDANQEFVTGEKPDDMDDYKPNEVEGVKEIYEGFPTYIKDRPELGETIKNTMLGINAFVGGNKLAEQIEQFDPNKLFEEKDD